MDPEYNINRKRRSLRGHIYTLGFFTALVEAMPLYINSSVLQKYIPDPAVGLVYTASAIAACLLFIRIPYILQRIGNFRFYLCLIAAYILAFGTLAVSHSAAFVVAAVALDFITVRMINFSNDVFLQNNSEERKTGGIRGTFLTAINTAVLISPSIAGLLIGKGNDYAGVYWAALAVLVPIGYIVFHHLRTFSDPVYEAIPFWATVKKIWNNRDLRGNFLIQTLLNFFYAWMILYTPLYLHDYIGFSWETIGTTFTIMLLPFILIEFPLGRLEDRWGERDALAAGLIIAGVSTIMLSFISLRIAAVWAAVLFITRIGASMIEVSSEAYFFKHIDGHHADLLGAFRTTTVIAYIIAPLIASLFLLFFDFKYIFAVLGIITLSGVILALHLKDAI